jgi:hypothetical protein
MSTSQSVFCCFTLQERYKEGGKRRKKEIYVYLPAVVVENTREFMGV